MSMRVLGTKLIARSGLGKGLERLFIHKGYYYAKYPDVALANADPVAHFMAHGWKEGRNPSASFNTLYYRDAYLAGLALNPLSHFLESGAKATDIMSVPASSKSFVQIQRLLTADFFDTTFYKMQGGGIDEEDPLVHYLTIGWKDELSPSPTFDVRRYYAEHPFVKALDVSPLYHFASQRRLRGKEPLPSVERIRTMSTRERSDVKSAIEPEFDATYYARSYPDVKKAGIEPLAHFIDHGWQEGRNPSPTFDCKYYLTENDDVAASGVNPFYHFITQGRSAGLRGNAVGNRLHPPMVAPTAIAWATATPAAATQESEFVVIIPVYKGYDETMAAIHAVLTSKQTTRFALHVINDVSPDPQLTEALEALAARGLFSYVRNATNIGFVKSVNSGLLQFPDKEIILLNSDAKVFGNWIDRIAFHARRDPTIATITPLSNNATICSYPLVNHNNILQMEQSAEEIDAMAAECNKGRVTDIPTGVGFCFYMSRASRSAVGILDEEAFGRGYGEENDFCLRVAKAGFRNVLAEDIFVYHAGEVSFSEFVTEEYGPGQKALLFKHPDYPARVHQHLEADATAIGRMRLDLFRLARHLRSNAIVFFYHALAGGIVTHVEHMERRLAEEGVAVIHVRVGVGGRWNVDLKSGFKTTPYCPNLLPFAFHQIQAVFAEFLTWLVPKAIHVHSFVGFDWQATLAMMDLIRQSAVPYYFTLHDYSIVCHRDDLVQVNQTYCELPDVSVCKSCVASDNSYPEGIDPAVRRQTYKMFLEGAKNIFAPSEDIKKRLSSVGATYAVTVRPHEEILKQHPIRLAPRDAAVRDVVLIGAIGAHKGSRVLLNLARDAKQRLLPIRYTIIGHSDQTEELALAGVLETGRYKTESEVFGYLRDLKPACIFLPSIWPETFCYALSMAFKTEIPPVVFDIGAQADRVQAANFGFILPYGLIDDIPALNDRIRTLPSADMVWTQANKESITYPSILDDYYGLKRA